MKKWIWLLALAIGLCCTSMLLAEEDAPLEPLQPMATARPEGYSVVLNEYPPEAWNGGYGHYDLTFSGPENQSFRCHMGGISVECKTITLSYGPTDGDNSPARVFLYPQERSEHVPSSRLTLYRNLALEDFNSFMMWFMNTFASYSKAGEQHHVFRVVDDAYATYSLSEARNCLSAALYMVNAIPGAKDTEKNPCAALIEQLETSMLR